MHPLLEELVAGAASGALSGIQVDLVMTRASDWATWTYAHLIAHYHLSGPTPLIHAFVRTACGRFWAPSMPGARDTYLGALDLVKFRAEALERAQEFDCLTIHDAISLAATLKRERLHRAVELIRMCHLELASHLSDEGQPSRTWVHEIAEICGLRIAPPNISGSRPPMAL
jgi:hypothetical protein